MKTGSDFIRPFGPDLTGLFGGERRRVRGEGDDHATPAIHDGEAFAYGSFAFDEPDTITAPR